MRPLSYDESIRLLINGICGPNPNLIARETSTSRHVIGNWLVGKVESEKTRDIVANWLWKQLNKHVILTDEDYDNPQKKV